MCDCGKNQRVFTSNGTTNVSYGVIPHSKMSTGQPLYVKDMQILHTPAMKQMIEIVPCSVDDKSCAPQMKQRALKQKALEQRALHFTGHCKLPPLVTPAMRNRCSGRSTNPVYLPGHLLEPSGKMTYTNVSLGSVIRKYQDDGASKGPIKTPNNFAYTHTDSDYFNPMEYVFGKPYNY
jgi:hypothetical protein